jgi:hypothetical protein
LLSLLSQGLHWLVLALVATSAFMLASAIVSFQSLVFVATPIYSKSVAPDVAPRFALVRFSTLLLVSLFAVLAESVALLPGFDSPVLLRVASFLPLVSSFCLVPEAVYVTAVLPFLQKWPNVLLLGSLFSLLLAMVSTPGPLINEDASARYDLAGSHFFSTYIRDTCEHLVDSYSFCSGLNRACLMALATLVLAPTCIALRLAAVKSCSSWLLATSQALLAQKRADSENELLASALSRSSSAPTTQSSSRMSYPPLGSVSVSSAAARPMMAFAAEKFAAIDVARRRLPITVSSTHCVSTVDLTHAGYHLAPSRRHVLASRYQALSPTLQLRFRIRSLLRASFVLEWDVTHSVYALLSPDEWTDRSSRPATFQLIHTDHSIAAVSHAIMMAVSHHLALRPCNLSLLSLYAQMTRAFCPQMMYDAALRLRAVLSQSIGQFGFLEPIVLLFSPIRLCSRYQLYLLEERLIVGIGQGHSPGDVDTTALSFSSIGREADGSKTTIEETLRQIRQARQLRQAEMHARAAIKADAAFFHLLAELRDACAASAPQWCSTGALQDVCRSPPQVGPVSAMACPATNPSSASPSCPSPSVDLGTCTLVSCAQKVPVVVQTARPSRVSQPSSTHSIIRGTIRTLSAALPYLSVSASVILQRQLRQHGVSASVLEFLQAHNMFIPFHLLYDMLREINFHVIKAEEAFRHLLSTATPSILRGYGRFIVTYYPQMADVAMYYFELADAMELAAEDPSFRLSPEFGLNGQNPDEIEFQAATTSNAVYISAWRGGDQRSDTDDLSCSDTSRSTSSSASSTRCDNENHQGIACQSMSRALVSVSTTELLHAASAVPTGPTDDLILSPATPASSSSCTITDCASVEEIPFSSLTDGSATLNRDGRGCVCSQARFSLPAYEPHLQPRTIAVPPYTSLIVRLWAARRHARMLLSSVGPSFATIDSSLPPSSSSPPPKGISSGPSAISRGTAPAPACLSSCPAALNPVPRPSTVHLSRLSRPSVDTIAEQLEEHCSPPGASSVLQSARVIKTHGLSGKDDPRTPVPDQSSELTPSPADSVLSLDADRSSASALSPYSATFVTLTTQFLSDAADAIVAHQASLILPRRWERQIRRPTSLVLISAPLLLMATIFLIWVDCAVDVRDTSHQAMIATSIFSTAVDVAAGWSVLSLYGSPYPLLHAIQALRGLLQALETDYPLPSTSELTQSMQFYGFAASMGAFADPSELFPLPTPSQMMEASSLSFEFAWTPSSFAALLASLVPSEATETRYLTALDATVDLVSMSSAYDCALTSASEVPILQALHEVVLAAELLSACALSLVPVYEAEGSLILDLLLSETGVSPEVATALVDVQANCLDRRSLSAAIVTVSANLAPTSSVMQVLHNASPDLAILSDLTNEFTQLATVLFYATAPFTLILIAVAFPAVMVPVMHMRAMTRNVIADAFRCETALISTLSQQNGRSIGATASSAEISSIRSSVSSLKRPASVAIPEVSCSPEASSLEAELTVTAPQNTGHYHSTSPLFFSSVGASKRKSKQLLLQAAAQALIICCSVPFLACFMFFKSISAGSSLASASVLCSRLTASLSGLFLSVTALSTSISDYFHPLADADPSYAYARRFNLAVMSPADLLASIDIVSDLNALRDDFVLWQEELAVVDLLAESSYFSYCMDCARCPFADNAPLCTATAFSEQVTGMAPVGVINAFVEAVYLAWTDAMRCFSTVDLSDSDCLAFLDMHADADGSGCSISSFSALLSPTLSVAVPPPFLPTCRLLPALGDPTALFSIATAQVSQTSQFVLGHLALLQTEFLTLIAAWVIDTLFYIVLFVPATLLVAVGSRRLFAIGISTRLRKDATAAVHLQDRLSAAKVALDNFTSRFNRWDTN